ncbi:DNA replication protein [Pectobacterium carotovorum]|uniref:DNA replication protein n=1 Tax=Pectobacterium carotovorum TaxID=554 RepID=UPI0021F294F5|nr:DNA replication protein [Pectobacterium carotovorum]
MSNVTNLAVAREARRPQESPRNGGKGFTLLHRKIQDAEFYKKDSQAVHLWIHLILSVNHCSATVSTDYGDVVVDRGQVITSAPKLGNETGIGVERVKYLLKKFRKLGMIESYSPGKFTVLTITKYDEYQGKNEVKTFPQDSRNFPSDNPGAPSDTGESFPQDSRNFPTNKEVLNNNSLGKPNECASAAENQGKKKPSISCQDVVDAYHEILPEAPSIRLLSEKRKNLIRTFWKKAGVITRKLDNKPFTIESWREYLGYISLNCRWMLENRPNQKTGTTWRKRDFEFYLNDNTYLKVREGGHDDNDR